MKSCVIYLTKINKISAASQTVDTLRIAPKICMGQPPTMCAQCSRFHPNRFQRSYSRTGEHRSCPVKYFHYSPDAMPRFGRFGLYNNVYRLIADSSNRFPFRARTSRRTDKETDATERPIHHVGVYTSGVGNDLIL